MCYKTFIGALQTRFAHSIGTYYLAKKLLQRKEINKTLTLNQINTIKAAALLHDIGHGPHSHGFE
ncbi:HD domain-containing protein [bacterium]|nr:HD domain-containing protein [bacterium]